MEENNVRIDDNFVMKNVSGSKNSNTDKIRNNPWILSTFFLGLLVLFLILQSFGVLGNVTGNVVSQNLIQENVDLVLENVYGLEDYQFDSIERFEDFYLVSVMVNETSYPFESTLDGEFVRVPNGIWIKISELKFAIQMEENSQNLPDSGFTPDQVSIPLEENGSEMNTTQEI